MVFAASSVVDAKSVQNSTRSCFHFKKEELGVIYVFSGDLLGQVKFRFHSSLIQLGFERK